jgi:lipoprotein signal peptidase
MPAWVPFSNVFSIGDVIIVIGVVIVIVAAMRQGRPATAPG